MFISWSEGKAGSPDHALKMEKSSSFFAYWPQYITQMLPGYDSPSARVVFSF